MKEITAYINGYPTFTMNYCKSIEEAQKELESNDSFQVYSGGIYKTVKINKNDKVEARYSK